MRQKDFYFENVNMSIYYSTSTSPLKNKLTEKIITYHINIQVQHLDNITIFKKSLLYIFMSHFSIFLWVKLKPISSYLYIHTNVYKTRLNIQKSMQVTYYLKKYIYIRYVGSKCFVEIQYTSPKIVFRVGNPPIHLSLTRACIYLKG